MALTPGARLGPYEVGPQIGAGGMGEVYRATDTNLKRGVAIVPHDANAGERGVNFPFFLSDGRRFLVHVAGAEGKSSIHLASLDSADRKLVIDGVQSAPLLAPTPRGRSYLLYLQDETLLAHEFDETSGTVQGDPRTLVRGIGRVASPALMPTAGVSPTGTLAFQTGDFIFESFTWLNRAGDRLGTVPLEVTGVNPSLSPDGRLIAFQGNMGSDLDVWVHDVARGISSRLTRGKGDDRSPIWSPDGQRVAFARSGKIYVKSADGDDEKPEVFFIAADRSLMVVDLRVGKTLSAGVPRKLIPLKLPVNVGYDVTGDGQRFLVNSPAEDVPDTPITVVVNWWAELAKGSN